jgi:hypothetical protein
MPVEATNNIDSSDAHVIRGNRMFSEISKLEGYYTTQCFDKDGNLKWEDKIENTVVDAGKKLALDTFIAGSAYTVVGPFMGLISSVGWSAVAATDTMASHAGWYECGVDGSHGPTVAARLTTNAGWSAATGSGTVSKSLSSALSFTIATVTGGTSVQGCFLVYGSGAVNTIGSTAGTLYSGGAFSGGAKTVAVNDIIQVSYTTSM